MFSRSFGCTVDSTDSMSDFNSGFATEISWVVLRRELEYSTGIVERQLL